MRDETGTPPVPPPPREEHFGHKRLNKIGIGYTLLWNDVFNRFSWEQKATRKVQVFYYIRKSCHGNFCCTLPVYWGDESLVIRTGRFRRHDPFSIFEQQREANHTPSHTTPRNRPERLPQHETRGVGITHLAFVLRSKLARKASICQRFTQIIVHTLAVFYAAATIEGISNRRSSILTRPIHPPRGSRARVSRERPNMFREE